MAFCVHFWSLTDVVGYNKLPLYGKEVHTDSSEDMFHRRT